jgi:hypothetical protein
MAQIASIAILDGATTPVTHTFTPIATQPVPNYREAIPSLALVGQGRIAIENRTAASASLQKVTVRLELPALETASGQNAEGYTAAPKVAYTNSVRVDLILPARGTVQQRKDLRIMLSNLLKDAQVIDAIDNLAQPY